ncbi:MAG TPA: PAS domain-containing sensor histidine kinase [Cyclobacteriaceae bacterium]|nr:PAS domain-containing sensor histidine kinase [Cyclobacteriaceae bacterium]
MINPFELSVVSNDAFREIFQSMTEGIIVVDKAGKILVANPIAEEMFGYGNNELTGMQLEQLLPERYRQKHFSFRDQFNNKPAPRKMGTGRDLAALRKNGMEFPVEISLSFSQAQGTFIAIAFITDITQRKKVEEALRQGEEQLMVYATELEKKVKARTEDLNTSIVHLEKEIAERKRAEEDARKALEKERELNELKSKFVSIASHEFRTPLSTILSSTSLIEQYNRKGEHDKVQKHTQRVRSSVNHLTGILNDFLSLGKLEEGKIDVKLESVDLCGLLEEVKEEMHVQLKENQEIVIDCKTNKTATLTDSRILRNILFNLLSNASKYSEGGKSIFLSTVEVAGGYELSIRDEGIGIPDSDKKHMFERFFRATNAGNVQGTGLGLNIVKRYVDLLNGKISFVSKHNVGTTFTVFIPKSS